MKPCLSTKKQTTTTTTKNPSIAWALRIMYLPWFSWKGHLPGKFYITHHTACCLKFFLTFLSPPEVPHTWLLLNCLHSVCIFSNSDPSYQPLRIIDLYSMMASFLKRSVPKNTAKQNSSQPSTEWERLEISSRKYQGNISCKDGHNKGQKWYGPNRSRRY